MTRVHDVQKKMQKLHVESDDVQVNISIDIDRGPIIEAYRGGKLMSKEAYAKMCKRDRESLGTSSPNLYNISYTLEG